MKKHIESLLSPSTNKRFFFFLFFDFVLIVGTGYVAFLLRFEGIIPEAQFANLRFVLFVVPPFLLLALWREKLYRASWAYVSIVDLMALVRGLSISFFIFAVLVFILRDGVFSTFPRSVIFIHYFLTIIFLGGFRISKRVHARIKNQNGAGRSEGDKRVLIIGAGDAGEQLLRQILSGALPGYTPVGFIDDDPLKQKLSIHGYRVLGTIGDISQISKEEAAEAVIIALPSSGSREIKRAVEISRDAGIAEVKIVPSLSELLLGGARLGDLRDVQIEDLLGRDPAKLNRKALEEFIRDRRVLITGAAGSIGSELARQVCSFQPQHLILLDHDETALFYLSQEFKKTFPKITITSIVGSIQNKSKMKRIMKEKKPQLVFHSAAYKHVSVIEEHPDEGVRNNILGTIITAEAAAQAGVERFIFISTDKAVKPASAMGKTKRVGEILMSHLNSVHPNTQFISVRFGNVLGSQGSVIPLFREQIKSGGPVRVTHPDMERYFMSISEAVLLVIQTGVTGEGGRIYILDMGKPVKILDLAREMITLSGYKPDIDMPIVFSDVGKGEKITEQLFDEKTERLIPTSFPKIFEISYESSSSSSEIFFQELEALFTLLEEEERDALLEKLDNMSS